MAEKSTRKTTRPKSKRPWRRPQVKSGQLFESNSLACGKTPQEAGMRDECGAGAHSS